MIQVKKLTVIFQISYLFSFKEAELSNLTTAFSEKPDWFSSVTLKELLVSPCKSKRRHDWDPEEDDDAGGDGSWCTASQKATVTPKGQYSSPWKHWEAVLNLASSWLRLSSSCWLETTNTPFIRFSIAVSEFLEIQVGTMEENFALGRQISSKFKFVLVDWRLSKWHWRKGNSSTKLNNFC